MNLENTCPVLTPAERQVVDAIGRADRFLMETVHKALDDATRQAAEEMISVGSPEKPPAFAYFASVVHQRMFCLLCGADPETMQGGDPEMAARILENGRNISAHYWNRTNSRDEPQSFTVQQAASVRDNPVASGEETT
ncbi:hypothetical protein [Neorhizobium galegae]|uniref:hypothetical protein n=1 Tax=Neorhizobium galegae TaxID=399 RepID=UPI00288C1DCA|nr:hypothetical protein [Neorhizobium galegae]